MLRSPPLAILLLAGCNSTLSAYDASDAVDGAPVDGGTDVVGDDDDDATDDTSDPGTDDTGGGPTLPPGAIEVMLDDITPDFGTNAGGTEVTITGGPFDNLVEVTFGGQAATVLSSTTSEMVLQTPSSSTEGWVDVHAVTDDGNSVTPVQFQFWEDGAGRTGALGALEWYNYVGGYWADPQPQPYGFGQAFFIEPASVSFGQAYFSNAVDTCTLNYAGAPTTPEAPGVARLDLTPQVGGTVPLFQDSTPGFEYFYFNSPAAAYGHNPNLSAAVLGNRFDLEPTVGSPDWPEMSVQAFTGEVPTDPPMVTNPALASTNPPSINASFTLQWGGQSGDYVAARLIRQRWDGALWVNQEDLTCWFADDGQQTVPNLWSAWDNQNDGVFFIVGRFNEPPAATTLPHNGASSHVVGAHWTIGFAVAQ